jgi:hypothetical protein
MPLYSILVVSSSAPHYARPAANVDDIDTKIFFPEIMIFRITYIINAECQMVLYRKRNSMILFSNIAIRYKVKITC